MESPLFLRLKSLWETQLPFVCFRLPNQKKATLYFQKDSELYVTHDLNCSGFLMAPFDLNKKIPFIPDQYAELFNLKKTNPQNKKQTEIPFDSTNKKTFLELVSHAQKVIESGELKKVVLSHKLEVATKKDPISIFNELVIDYPLAMVYLWYHPSVGTWFGASPEQFISSFGDKTQTMALAGTQSYKEGENPLWTQKEIEEQELVAVQIDSDLKKLFSSNQIHRSSTTDHRAGDLIHLCTYFQFPKLESNLLALAQVLHPTPAVGGVPKIKAKEFIEQYESYDRAFYTGFLGVTNTKETHLFVNLRCAQWTPERTTLYVGAGITSGSDPEKEWLETIRKAKTLAKVL